MNANNEIPKCRNQIFESNLLYLILHTYIGYNQLKGTQEPKETRLNERTPYSKYLNLHLKAIF